MTKKERIIVKYLSQRWYKKALVITESERNYFGKIKVLKFIACSGYLDVEKPLNCIFDVEAWPFEYKFFDLIILDESLVNCPKQMNALLNQLHFCLADDGEVIVACSGSIRLYKLISKFLANGFISEKLSLVNVTDNFMVNTVKKIISKNFVMVFKKDNFFTANVLKVEDFVGKSVKSKVYSGGCAREVYGDIQKEK